MSYHHWHIVAYDICCPSRLQRVHKKLAANGLAMQRSVFLVKANHRQLKRLLDQTAELIDPKEDDLRAYPVGHPASLWLSGTSESMADQDASEQIQAKPWTEKMQDWLKILRRAA